MRVPRFLASSLLLLILTSCGGGEDSNNDISVRGAKTPDGDGSRNNEAAGEVGSAAESDGIGEGETRETVGDSAGTENEDDDRDGESNTAADGDGESAGTDGCGAALTPGVSTLSVSANGDSRNYIRVIPSGYEPNSPYPVVFAWHGQGGNGALARAYYGIEKAADDAAIFIYPDGLPQGQAGSDTGWDLSSSGDVVLFDALLTQISADACVNSERVFSTGHSFGGYISNALACYRGDKIRAIGEVAGGPSYWPCGKDIEVAAWLAHDPTDAIVAISDGTKARDQHLERNGCAATTSAVSPEPCVSYNDCKEGNPVVWCEHDEGGRGGHGWPNFAGSAIWDFFTAQ